jgi:hypothetical protein
MSRAVTPNRSPSPPAWAPECKTFIRPGNNATIVSARTVLCMKTSLKHKFLELTGQQDFAVADENESLIQLMNSKNIDDSAESLRSVLKEHGVRSFKMAEFDAIVSKVKRALALNNTHRHTNNNNGSSGGKRNSKKGKTTKRNIKGKSSTRRSKSWF